MNNYPTIRLARYARRIGALLTALLIPVMAFSQSPLPVNLGSAATFELLAGSTITNVGNTVIMGDIGVFPGTGNVITGFPPGIVSPGGQYIGVGPASVAQGDLTAAFNDAAGRTGGTTQNSDLGGMTITPGVYTASTSLGITGNVTLDALGDANAVWIFQIGSALTTATNSTVTLAGDAQSKNIFWQVGSSATIQTGSVFYGNILAQASISVGSGAIVVGRLLARDGAVSAAGAMSGTNPDLLPSNAPIFTTALHDIDVGRTHVDSVKSTLVVISNTGTADLIITGATSTNTAFSSHLSGTTLAPGTSIFDTIKFLPVTMGDDSGKLWFTSNAATSPDSIKVYGLSTVARLSTALRDVNVGSAHIDSSSWTVILLTNTGNDTLRFTSMASNNAAFSSRLSAPQIAPGATILDSIMFLPLTIGADSGKLLFIGNAITSPDTIVVRGVGRAAVLFTTSDNVYTGTTQVGTVGWTLVRLTNTGNDTLRFASITSSNAVFSSHLSALKIGPGEYVIDSIKFLPMQIGADSGKLIFIGNETTSPDTITVHGIGNGAMLFTTSRTVNVGATHVDSTLWTLITLTNTGNDTLRFTTATSTNAVFSSHLSAMKVAPGASIVDSIMFVPGMMGADSGKLIFTGNGFTSPDTIAVRGIGRTAILEMASRDVYCGASLIGVPTLTLVTFTNPGNDTLRLSAATSSNGVFTSRLSEAVIAPGGSVVDMIVFLPTAAGEATGELSFVSNAVTSPDVLIVRGMGIAAAKAAILSTASRNVDCGTTQIGTSIWTQITLTNMGNDTLRFTSLTSTNAVFSSHLSALLIAPGAWVIDSIKFLPTAVGSTTGHLILIGNAATSPDTISVFGIGVNSARGAILATASRNVDCGTTQVTKHTWTLLTLYNTGTDSLHITRVASTNGVFVSNMSEIVIGPGESVVDLVVFLPTVEGTATGKLIFTSNAITSPDTVGVHGIGTPLVGVDEGTAPLVFALGELYPNPLSDVAQLHVRLQDSEQLLQAGMYDILGRSLQDWTSRIASDGTLSLHLGAYPKGEYFIVLRTTERIQVLPVVIVK